jgi:hypothetical protein
VIVVKIHGNPGPGKMTVQFESGKFNGKSITLDAEPISGGVILYSDSIRKWDGENGVINEDLKKEVIGLIRNKLRQFPPSDIE